MNTTELTKRLITPAKNRFVTYRGLTCEKIGNDLALTVACMETGVCIKEFGIDIKSITGYRVENMVVAESGNGIVKVTYYLK